MGLFSLTKKLFKTSNDIVKEYSSKNQNLNTVIFNPDNHNIWFNGVQYGNGMVGTNGGEFHNDYLNSNPTGNYSSTFGSFTDAKNANEAAFGTFNESTEGSTLFSVGNGDNNTRHNIFELTLDGKVKVNNNDVSELFTNTRLLSEHNIGDIINASMYRQPEYPEISMKVYHVFEIPVASYIKQAEGKYVDPINTVSRATVEVDSEKQLEITVEPGVNLLHGIYTDLRNGVNINQPVLEIPVSANEGTKSNFLTNNSKLGYSEGIKNSCVFTKVNTTIYNLSQNKTYGINIGTLNNTIDNDQDLNNFIPSNGYLYYNRKYNTSIFTCLDNASGNNMGVAGNDLNTLQRQLSNIIPTNYNINSISSVFTTDYNKLDSTIKYTDWYGSCFNTDSENDLKKKCNREFMVNHSIYKETASDAVYNINTNGTQLGLNNNDSVSSGEMDNIDNYFNTDNPSVSGAKIFNIYTTMCKTNIEGDDARAIYNSDSNKVNIINEYKSFLNKVKLYKGNKNDYSFYTKQFDNDLRVPVFVNYKPTISYWHDNLINIKQDLIYNSDTVNNGIIKETDNIGDNKDLFFDGIYMNNINDNSSDSFIYAKVMPQTSKFIEELIRKHNLYVQSDINKVPIYTNNEEKYSLSTTYLYKNPVLKYRMKYGVGLLSYTAIRGGDEFEELKFGGDRNYDSKRLASLLSYITNELNELGEYESYIGGKRSNINFAYGGTYSTLAVKYHETNPFNYKYGQYNLEVKTNTSDITQVEISNSSRKMYKYYLWIAVPEYLELGKFNYYNYTDANTENAEYGQGILFCDLYNKDKNNRLNKQFSTKTVKVNSNGNIAREDEEGTYKTYINHDTQVIHIKYRRPLENSGTSQVLNYNTEQGSSINCKYQCNMYYYNYNVYLIPFDCSAVAKDVTINIPLVTKYNELEATKHYNYSIPGENTYKSFRKWTPNDEMSAFANGYSNLLTWINDDGVTEDLTKESSSDKNALINSIYNNIPEAATLAERDIFLKSKIYTNIWNNAAI